VKIETESPPDSELVLFGSSFALPHRFTATVTPDDPELPVCHLAIVVEGGRAVCEALRCERRPGGEPISGTVLRRIPVADYTRRAASQLAKMVFRARETDQLVVTDEGGEEWPIQTWRVDEDHVAVPTGGLDRDKGFQSEYAAAGPRGRYIGAVTDEQLRDVAETYRAAYAERRAPTAAVARRFHVSRSTAGRYVQRARERGFLGPTQPRVAGEQQP
jgi:hypothetical protein